MDQRRKVIQTCLRTKTSVVQSVGVALCALTARYGSKVAENAAPWLCPRQKSKDKTQLSEKEKVYEQSNQTPAREPLATCQGPSGRMKGDLLRVVANPFTTSAHQSSPQRFLGFLRPMSMPCLCHAAADRRRPWSYGRNG